MSAREIFDETIQSIGKTYFETQKKLYKIYRGDVDLAMKKWCEAGAQAMAEYEEGATKARATWDKALELTELMLKNNSLTESEKNE